MEQVHTYWPDINMVGSVAAGWGRDKLKRWCQEVNRFVLFFSEAVFLLNMEFMLGTDPAAGGREINPMFRLIH